MSVAAPVNERLAAITEAGTSVWLDQISRALIQEGELERLVQEYLLRGVTSNPTIFEKAIAGSEDYDEELAGLAREGLSSEEIADRIMVHDVRDAADVLRGVHDATDGLDGYVSLEVAPTLANDTEGTIAAARRYFAELERPNVFIKIPGTEAGVPAIEQCIADGININVTLLFSVEAYAKVAEAYIRGLERRREAGESIDVASVASFFVSRVDTEADKRLEALGRPELAGTAAVANARAAYQRFKEIFRGERFAELAAAGARVQRPLWASTGVKNPHYPETKYVDSLIAPDTVNTMPLQTLMAAGEHSVVQGATADQDPTAELEALREAGIDIDDVTDKLLRDGIELFIQPMKKLLARIDSERDAVLTGRPKTIQASLPDELVDALAARASQAEEQQVARRVWRKDESLWGGPGVPEIGDRLGWLTTIAPMREAAQGLRDFRAECRAEGLTDVVLCGMGGSSLAPEVMRRSFGALEGGLRLHVLDSTDPAAIRAVEAAIDLEKTLFLISSKSGGTIETLSHFRYFHAKQPDGRHFAAITDPRTSLAELAERSGFRRVFLNDPEVGGRYSALTYFGLVPAALMGVDPEALLDTARVAEQSCARLESRDANSGLWLGLAMGELARQGRDKLTYVVSEPVASFGLWVEQLVAESTGKHGRGIVPVVDEPLGDPGAYGDDRVFCYLRNPDAPPADEAVAALTDAGQPTVTLTLQDGADDLGRLFFFAEFATAVAGWVLGINAFDQPNVQEAKDKTAEMLARAELPDLTSADDAALRELLGGAGPPHYVAVTGFMEPSEAVDAAVAELRTAIRKRTRSATTFGYGPRYLHSTGQLHKGGPPTGAFLQLVHDEGEDAEIPEAGYGFRKLEHAQALGDLETLRGRGLPAERVVLEGDPAEAIRTLAAKVEESL